MRTCVGHLTAESVFGSAALALPSRTSLLAGGLSRDATLSLSHVLCLAGPLRRRPFFSLPPYTESMVWSLLLSLDVVNGTFPSGPTRQCGHAKISHRQTKCNKSPTSSALLKPDGTLTKGPATTICSLFLNFLILPLRVVPMAMRKGVSRLVFQHA